MATEGGRIDFMFLAPLTRPLDPLLDVRMDAGKLYPKPPADGLGKRGVAKQAGRQLPGDAEGESFCGPVLKDRYRVVGIVITDSNPQKKPRHLHIA